MIKIKWFIAASLFLCTTFSGVMYWHYLVMQDVFGEMEKMNSNSHLQVNRQVQKENRKRLEMIAIDVEKGGERKKDMFILEQAKQTYVLTRELRKELDHVSRSLEDLGRGAEVFSIWQNNQFFIQEGRATHLYHTYKVYLEALKELCKHEPELFPLPKQQEFIDRFQSKPLPISKSAIYELDYQISRNQRTALDYIAKRMGGCSLSFYVPNCDKIAKMITIPD